MLYVQIAAAVADSDGLEHVDEPVSTPEGGQIHAFMDPISAMGKADYFFFSLAKPEVSMTNHIMCSLPHMDRN